MVVGGFRNGREISESLTAGETEDNIEGTGLPVSVRRKFPSGLTGLFCWLVPLSQGRAISDSELGFGESARPMFGLTSSKSISSTCTVSSSLPSSLIGVVASS